MSARRVRLALLGLALAAWLATGVTTVASNEAAVVLRLGRAARVVAPGVALKLPWPLERVERVDVELLRRMTVGYRLVDAERGIDPLPEEVQWLTGDTNIVELRANVLFRVVDPVAWLYGVADGAGDEGHRAFALRRVGESVLSALIARMPVAAVLAPGGAGLAVRARDGIQAAADALGLGVRITTVEVLDATPPLMVIHSFNSVTDARAVAERLVVEARGTRLRDLQEAEATANRVVGEARSYAAGREGRAEGLTQRLAALAGAEGGRGLSAVAVRAVWAETLRRILGRARVTLLPASPSGGPVRFHRVR